MPRRAEQVALAAIVLLLHLLLWWSWPRSAAPERGSRPDAVAQAPLSVRLLTLPPAPATVAAPEAAAPRAPVRPAAAPAIGVVRSVPSDPTATVEAAASSPRDIDLRLPSAAASPRSPSLREQGLNDPRSNTPRATVESRIAALNGPDRWEAEPMDATRTRWRRNGKCIEVHVSRNAQIDPYNQSFSPTPKLVKPDCD
jgi:hypothetical protein